MAAVRLNEKLFLNRGYSKLKATEKLLLLELAWAGAGSWTAKEAGNRTNRSIGEGDLDGLIDAGFVVAYGDEYSVSEEVLKETGDRSRLKKWREAKRIEKATNQQQEKEIDMCPPCNYNAVLDLYHAKLPTLNQCRVLTDARKKFIQTRWREMCQRTANKTAAETLGMFDLYFDKVAQSPFLLGNGQARNGGRPWQADLEWLMRPSNFAKVIEGRYDR